MLYQDRVLSLINTYISNSDLPHTLMLEGAKGCGKKTLCKYIANKLNAEFIDLTDNITLEVLEQIQLSVSTKVYYIDGQQISVKEQNAILKFLEEPLKTAYIILCVENKNLLLPTVVNRCVSIAFDTYSTEVLREFLEGDEIILKYAQTPGQVKDFANHKIRDMEAFAIKVLKQIGVANYSNILKIPTNINFSKEPSELFDFDVFIFILINVASILYTNNEISYQMFDVVSKFNRECNIPRINKQHLFENFIIKLKQVTENI